MRILLDTHAFLFWIADSGRLSPRAREIFRDPGHVLFWSAASSWEIAIKVGLRRLELARPPGEIFPEQLRLQRIRSLPVEHAHAFRVAELPLHHRDPFDRLLVAQAQVEGLAVLSRDPVFRAYDVEVIW